MELIIIFVIIGLVAGKSSPAATTGAAASAKTTGTRLIPDNKGSSQATPTTYAIPDIPGLQLPTTDAAKILAGTGGAVIPLPDLPSASLPAIGGTFPLPDLPSGAALLPDLPAVNLPDAASSLISGASGIASIPGIGIIGGLLSGITNDGTTIYFANGASHKIDSTDEKRTTDFFQSLKAQYVSYVDSNKIYMPNYGDFYNYFAWFYQKLDPRITNLSLIVDQLNMQLNGTAIPIFTTLVYLVDKGMAEDWDHKKINAAYFYDELIKYLKADPNIVIIQPTSVLAPIAEQAPAAANNIALLMRKIFG